MEQNLKSAIIGYYLSGTTLEEIVGLTGCFYLQIAKVIEEYKKKIEHN